MSERDQLHTKEIVSFEAPALVNHVLSVRYLPQRKHNEQQLADAARNLWLQIREEDQGSEMVQVEVVAGNRRADLNFLSSSQGDLETFKIKLYGPGGQYNVWIDYDQDEHASEAWAPQHICPRSRLV